MTAPKKPARRPGGAKSVVLDTPPPVLTTSEMDLLAAFRSMDDRSRAFIGRLAAAQAEDNPRRAVPGLTLVRGGAWYDSPKETVEAVAANKVGRGRSWAADPDRCRIDLRVDISCNGRRDARISDEDDAKFSEGFSTRATIILSRRLEVVDAFPACGRPTNLGPAAARI